MHWPPYRTLDLRDLLPSGWADDICALAEGPGLIDIMTGPVDSPWRFAVREGPAVRDAAPWLWALYHGPLRAFASRSHGRPLFPSNRLSSSMTLNLLSGPGAALDWHPDANPLTGVFFATTSHEADGGVLEFRDAEGRECQVVPHAGTFLCFRGSTRHRVTPLLSGAPRLSIPMLYYESATDQPFANMSDRYELP